MSAPSIYIVPDENDPVAFENFDDADIYAGLVNGKVMNIFVYDRNLAQEINLQECEILGIDPATLGLEDWQQGASIRRDENGNAVRDIATCGHCGRSWDDALSTSKTPAPSGRCPFEYDHKHEDDDE